LPTSGRLRTGKVPYDVLERCVLCHLGAESPRVLIGAALGEDAPIIEMGDRVIIAKVNPITGAEKIVGGLAVHINANDVATRGARPLWFQDVLLLPPGTTRARLERIMKDMDAACRQLGVQLIGGHTECVSGLERPVVVGFMIGEASRDRYVTTGGAKPGDKVIMTKTVGLEGTSIFATDLREKLSGFKRATLIRAAKMSSQISVVPEALLAVEKGGVHALHTPTEGGIINGLWEMAKAAGIGLRVYEESIPVAPETAEITRCLGVDPLKLLSSGALLMCVAPECVNTILEALSSIKVRASVIGEARPKDEGLWIMRGRKQRRIKPVTQDELFRVLETC